MLWILTTLQWRHISSTASQITGNSRPFVQQLGQAYNKENIKCGSAIRTLWQGNPHYRGSMTPRRVSDAESQWWCHYFPRRTLHAGTFVDCTWRWKAYLNLFYLILPATKDLLPGSTWSYLWSSYRFPPGWSCSSCFLSSPYRLMWRRNTAVWRTDSSCSPVFPCFPVGPWDSEGPDSPEVVGLSPVMTSSWSPSGCWPSSCWGQR